MHIGLFDSGVGGLTLVRELIHQFPNSSLIYLGDTARLPYGNKSPETLKKYSEENMAFLVHKKVEALVVACHSASSVLTETPFFEKVPIFNVIAPSCQRVLDKSFSKNIGVMATKATVESEIYTKHIQKLDPQAQVHSVACPLLVPLVEEKMIAHPMTQMALEQYLNPLKKAKVDTILLGCTHFPLLKKNLEDLYPQSCFVNPAKAVIQCLQQELKSPKKNQNPSKNPKVKNKDKKNLSHPSKQGKTQKQNKGKRKIKIYLTDINPSFLHYTSWLLKDPSMCPVEYSVEKISLQE